MSVKNRTIIDVLPNAKTHWKLFYCPKRNAHNNEYCISIELSNKKRQYTCLTFECLAELIRKTRLENRCYYEHISSDDLVKFYIDYEYKKCESNLKIDVEKALLTIAKLFIYEIQNLSNNERIAIEDMVLLKSSNEQKESYHMVLSNSEVCFLNTNCLCTFIIRTLCLVLSATLRHYCLRTETFCDYNINDDSKFSDMMSILQDVYVDWFDCKNCKINIMEFSVRDICNLFAFNGVDSIVSCIDLKVYNKEQDFRMLMCTKAGEIRPLVESSLLRRNSSNMIDQDSYNIDNELINYFNQLLQKSLITEPTSTNCYIIDNDNFNSYHQTNKKDTNVSTLGLIDMTYSVEKNELSNMKYFRSDEQSEDYKCARAWTESYLGTIGSLGSIHSINRGKYGRLIMCNIRNMNTCNEQHDDYFNDSTIYMNLSQNEFSVRCNRIPCNRKSWQWFSMS